MKSRLSNETKQRLTKLRLKVAGILLLIVFLVCSHIEYLEQLEMGIIK